MSGKWTPQEKLKAIKRFTIGGESKASVARDIGVPESTFRGWCKNEEKISYQARTSASNIDYSSENFYPLSPKRIKIDDQPYNLCMKSEGSSGSYSPSPVGIASGLNGLSTSQVNQQLRFWSWYQQSAYHALQMQATAQLPQLSPSEPEKPILYQQLTEEAYDRENKENNVPKDAETKIENNNRSVLDNLFLNNNTLDYECPDETGSLDAIEAVEHGEKFLNWLESCSDPSVTPMQIATLQKLMKNLKTGINLKSGDCPRKTKARRK